MSSGMPPKTSEYDQSSFLSDPRSAKRPDGAPSFQLVRCRSSSSRETKPAKAPADGVIVNLLLESVRILSPAHPWNALSGTVSSSFALRSNVCSPVSPLQKSEVKPASLF